MVIYIQAKPVPDWLREVAAAFPHIEVGEDAPTRPFDMVVDMGNTMTEAEVMAGLARDAEIPQSWPRRLDMSIEDALPGDLWQVDGRWVVLNAEPEKVSVTFCREDGRTFWQMPMPECWVECPPSFRVDAHE